MVLGKYHKKRNFKKTPEPKGKVSHQYQHLFVIQKHAASHLHYDFRLELNGVLKSWAVPKGPCLDPTVKRLAMHVEDHPVDYGFFEGIIPKGQYGGGTVLLWDQGSWKSLDKDPKKAYESGHLRFELDGKKLKGRWDLIRFKDQAHWFLIKYKDKYARSLDDYDITEILPDSVLSHQPIESLAEHYKKIWTKEGASDASKNREKKSKKLSLPKALPTQSFPDFIRPQLATLVDKPPSGDEWLHEVKFDGYRILALINNKNIVLKSRNNNDWTAYFPQVVADLKKLKLKKAIFDGEIVLMDAKGRSDFQLLQNAIKEETQQPFIYYIFDFLYYDQYDLKTLPLIQRKELLATILGGQASSLRYSDHIIKNGEEVYEHACEFALEGIISKQMNAPYITRRSQSWLKVKCLHRQEFVIGGYTKPQGQRDYFGSLYTGVFNEQGELEFTGNVGTGFTAASLKEIHKKLERLKQDNNPFNSMPPEAWKATWVKPTLIAEIEFTEWTSDGRLRHPSFKGLRRDKRAKDVVREREKPVDRIKSVKKKSTFKLSHPTKILYPEDGITKGDLLAYYETISDCILPFLRNRPLTLLRCPDSYQHCFYQRHFNKTTPTTLKAIPITSKGVTEDYLYLNDKKGLLTLVQMGVLEIHPWGSTIKKLEKPDWLTIDLDPAPDVAWKKVVEAAFDVKHYLEEYQLTSFVKTTGGKGLHVVVPIQPEYDWEGVKNFAHVFVEFLEQLKPKEYVSKMTKSKRTGKIFIDYLRNQRSATAISVYSTRARLHAPVSTPLHWDELSDNLKDNYFTISTIIKRLEEQKRDPWEAFWNVKQSLRLDVVGDANE
jgi:bifunctional non-homologous end joining protein LigD